jgi:hypothetical protein
VTSSAYPLGNLTSLFYDGSTAASWDANRIYGCDCDSPGWTVGLGDGETQVIIEDASVSETTRRVH